MGSLAVILAHKLAIASTAGIQIRRGRTGEALASYQQALAMMEALPSPSSVPLAVTLADYAEVPRGIGDGNTAEHLYRKPTALAEVRLGRNHAFVGGLLQEYARPMREGGTKSEARTLADAAQQIRTASGAVNLAGHTVTVEALRLSR
jgi:hypothetical protein